MDNNAESTQPWFIHASYLRPHPPYCAPGGFADLYDPATVGTPIPPHDERHALHDVLLALPETAAPTTDAEMRHLRAQYFGMISAVDREIGRLMDYLSENGLWDNTIIIVTSDHGEQLGDHGLKEKVGWFEESHHIPLIWRDPRQTSTHGSTISEFTESIDIMPTLAEVMEQPIPRQCDGYPLTAFLTGHQPPTWRTAATWEFDWRFTLIPHVRQGWPWDRRLETSHLTVRRSLDTAYVQFGDGTALCFDLDADPTWRTEVTDPAQLLSVAQQMLAWRSTHAERTNTDILMRDGGIGFWPTEVPWRDSNTGTI
jgi:arylsulfatase A-like enzyme